MAEPLTDVAVVRDELGSTGYVLAIDAFERIVSSLERISKTPCYHDLDTPNERLLDEPEPCPACIAREALEKVAAE